MNSKRGSHVGVILSFVIFITFIVFLYSILQPSLKFKENKEKLLDNLKVNLRQKFSADVETITFIINKTTSNNCVRLVGLAGQLASPNFVLKNESGGVVTNFQTDGTDLYINRSGLSANFFKVYDSEDFNSIAPGTFAGCEDVLNSEYIFKSAESGNEIFLSKINQTKMDYEGNYDFLKEELYIPIESNFGFFFTDRKTIIIKTDEENVSTSVYAEEIPILFVNKNADINPGFLTVRVW